MDDFYELYDLKVEVKSSDDGKPMVCNHKLGDYFTVTDDDLIEFPPGVRFPMFTLAAILPVLPAKQRETSKYDWMSTDAVIACPDPNCGGRFHISRGEKKVYRHSENTLTQTPE
ncbi:MAG: TIGR04076 family protein [Gammaproteobacteria bacterium]|nr:TIGR04076 family protein [Gammaproteobacteria bacterium]